MIRVYTSRFIYIHQDSYIHQDLNIHQDSCIYIKIRDEYSSCYFVIHGNRWPNNSADVLIPRPQPSFNMADVVPNLEQFFNPCYAQFMKPLKVYTVNTSQIEQIVLNPALAILCVLLI